MLPDDNLKGCMQGQMALNLAPHDWRYILTTASDIFRRTVLCFKKSWVTDFLFAQMQ
jgi:hypothetical protein